MFRRALSKARRYTMSFCVVISNNTSGKDEMQEILVIPQTELQDFTNLECLTTLQLPRVSIPLIGESPEESYEDPESVVNGSEKCSDTRTIVISDQFDPTYESNCEGVWGNNNTHGDTCNMFSSEYLSRNNSLGRIDATFEDISSFGRQVAKVCEKMMIIASYQQRLIFIGRPSNDISGRDEILDIIQTELQFVTKGLTALTLLSGRDEILDTIHTELQFVIKRLTALTIISSYIHEDEHNEIRFLDNEDSIMNEEGNLEYVDLSCPEMSASHSAPKQHYPPNRDIVLEAIKNGEVPQPTVRVYKVPPLLMKPEVYAKAAESKSKKQLGSDTKIVIPDEFSRAFSRDYRQIEKSQEFRPSEVQHLRMMLGHEVLGNDKSSLFEAADIYHQEFFTKTIELVTSSYSKCLRDASNISYIPVNDQPQQISIKLGLSNNTSFSKRQATQLHEQMISQLQILVRYDQLKYTRSYSVVNCKVHWLEQAHASDIILKLDSNVVVSLIKSSYLQEIILNISLISDSLVRKSQPVTVQTFQGIMQRMGLPVNPQLYEQLENSYNTNDSEELSNVVIFAEDCRMFYYIPVQRGSLLQRKDAREREEPVNPWGILFTVNKLTPGQQHLLYQSLKSDDYVTKSAQKDGVRPH